MAARQLSQEFGITRRFLRLVRYHIGVAGAGEHTKRLGLGVQRFDGHPERNRHARLSRREHVVRLDLVTSLAGEAVLDLDVQRTGTQGTLHGTPSVDAPCAAEEAGHPFPAVG
jgi:hypothetical protein